MVHERNTNQCEWTICTLGEIATRIKEKNSGRTGNVLTISAQHGLVSQLDFFNKNVASKNLDGYYYLSKGDFAYNKSYSEGYPFGVIKNLEKYNEGVVSTLYICFKISSNEASENFFKHYFSSNQWNSEVRNIAKEGGRSHGLLNVGVNEFFDIHIPVPPLEEQKKIADILSSVDNAISKTEDIIEQMEKVKKGLMQQLLTKGIGHTRFKQTEIGEIPEEWRLVTISEIIDLVSGQSSPASEVNVDGRGVPYVTGPEQWNGEHVEEIKWVENPRKIASDNCFFITVKGSGTGKIFPGGKYAIGRDIMAIIPKALATKEFIYYKCLLQAKKIVSNKVGMVPGISRGDILDYTIGLPSKDEQNKITKVLEEFDKKLFIEKRKLNSLETIKKGLMHHLLTGKVRVKVDDQEAVTT